MEENYTSKDEIGCFEELNSLKIKYKERLNFPLPQNLPIDFEKIEIDKGLLDELFGKVISIVQKYSKKKIERYSPDIKVLIENAKNGDFISINVLKPIFERCAENLKDRIPSNWNKGICPVCGGHPLMAYLREDDGKRILQCIICKTEWEFLRLKCPYCETEDSKYLQFFQTDDESPYRVDVCNNCKFFIKTLDKRKMSISDLEALDIKIRYLDILAIKEGYKKLYCNNFNKIL